MVEYKDKKWMLVILAILISFSFSPSFVNAWFGLDDGIALAAGCVFGVLTSAFSHQCLLYQPQASSGNLCEECNTANPFGGCTEYKCKAIGSNCKFVNNEGGEGGTCTSIAVIGAPKITEFEFGSIDKREVINVKKSGNEWNVNVLNRNEDYYVAFITDIPAVCRRASNPNTFSSSGGQNLKLTNGLVHADGTIFRFLNENDFNEQYSLCPEGSSSTCKDYILCSNDDKKSPLYSVSYQLRDTPDEQAPEIRTVEPENGAMFGINNLTYDFKIRVIDPAGIGGCRYSTTLKKYGQMTDNLDCVPANFGTDENGDQIIPDGLSNQNFVMECSKNFQILPNVKNHDIYVSCIDGLFNTHDPAEKFSYRGAETLSMNIKVDNTNYAAGELRELTGTRHDLIAETSGGDNDKSICLYSYAFENGQQSKFIEFENIPAGATQEVYENIVIRPTHTLRLDNILKYSGKYHFRVNCFDPVGNNLTEEVLLDVNLPGRRFDDAASTLSFVGVEPNGIVPIINPTLKVKLGGGVNGQGKGAECKWTTDTSKAYDITLDRNKFSNLEGTFLDGIPVDHGNGFAHEYSSSLGNLEDKKSYTYRIFCKDVNGAIKGPQNIKFNIDVTDATTPGATPDQCSIFDAKWVDSDGIRTLSKVKQNEPVSLLVKGTNCNGLKVNFNIYEDDAGPETGNPISSFEGTFIDGEAVVQWNAEWEDDAGGDPEYYFKALVNGNLKKESSRLTVEKIQCTINAACTLTGTQCAGKYDNGCNCVDIPNDNCLATTTQPPAQPGAGQISTLSISSAVSGTDGPNPVITLQTKGGTADQTNVARGRAACYYTEDDSIYEDNSGTEVIEKRSFNDYTEHILKLSGFKDNDMKIYSFKCIADDSNSKIITFKDVKIETVFSRELADPNLPKLTISTFKTVNGCSLNPTLQLITSPGRNAICRISEDSNLVRNNAGQLMSRQEHENYAIHSATLNDLTSGETYSYFARCVNPDPRIFDESVLTIIPNLQTTEVNDGQRTILNQCNVICSDPDGCDCADVGCVTNGRINQCQTCGVRTAPALIIKTYGSEDENTLNPKLLVETTGGVSKEGRSQCKYGTDIDAVRSGQGTLFDQANNLIGSTRHAAILSGLKNGDKRTYFVQCVDNQDKYNKAEKQIEIEISISTSPITPPTPTPGTPGECDVKELKWVDAQGNILSAINRNVKVNALVNGLNCGIGNIASYKIKEKDKLLGIDLLQHDDEIANGVVKFLAENLGIIEWISTRQSDEFSPDNEYYIEIQGKETGLLKVLEPPIQSTQLNILKTSPTGLYGKKQVRIEAEVQGGTNNGDTVECTFTGTGANILLASTKANKEKISEKIYKHYLDVTAPANGNYIVSINCQDIAGQTISKDISFNLQEDNLAPMIQQIITKGNTKYITLNEPATCEIIVGDAVPTTTSTWTQVSRDATNPNRQIINANTNYYLRCKDGWDNQMTITKINLGS